MVLNLKLLDILSFEPNMWTFIAALLFLVILIYAIIGRADTPVPPVPEEPQYKFPSYIFINNFKIKGDNLMTKVPFNSASVEIAFGAPKDKFNNDASVQEGTLKIESTDDSIMTVGPSEATPDNPYAAKVSFTGKAGAAQVKITADADLGEGVKTIEGVETFEVPAGEAAGFGASTVGDFVPNAEKQA